MSIYGMMAFNSAVDRMNQLQDNAMSLQAKKQELDLNAQKLDIAKRTKESEIKIANNQGALSDFQTKAMMDALKKQFGPMEDNLDAQSDAQDLTEHQLNQQMQQTQQAAAQIHAQDPDVQSTVGQIMANNSPKQTVTAPSPMAALNPLTSGTPGVAQPAPNAALPSIFPTISAMPSPIQQTQQVPVDQSPQATDAQVRDQGSPQAAAAPQGAPTPAPQAQPAPETQLPDLSQALNHLPNTPFGANPQKDYFMPNPNALDAIKTGKYLIQKPPEIINQENPLRLSDRQKFVEDHAKDLIKSGYTPEDVLQQLPSDLAETVDGIGRYKQSEQVLLGGMQATPQTRAAYIGLVRKIFPQYDVNKFAQAAEYRKQMADDSGNALGSRIVSANTVGSHLFQLSDLADQLNNQNAPVANAIVNFARTQLGHPEVTNFNQAKEIVSNEIENILSQKGATQSGVTRMEGNFNENMSPDQLKGFVQTNLPLIADRIQALRSQYKSNIGATDDGEILYPDTRQRFQDLYGQDVFKSMDKGQNPFKGQNALNANSAVANDAFMQKAKAAGYSDAEIQDYLSKRK